LDLFGYFKRETFDLLAKTFNLKTYFFSLNTFLAFQTKIKTKLNQNQHVETRKMDESLVSDETQLDELRIRRMNLNDELLNADDEGRQVTIRKLL
jgi:hypothetical protein